MNSVATSLNDLNLEPLWQRSGGGLQPAPTPEAPCLWRWKDIDALLDQVIANVPVDKVERRVLTLKNPDPRYAQTTTIRSINCGIQILMPGETAPPHRHSPNALRISLEGNGGETAVNGVSYEMRRGDVILTPSWTSHAHAHRADGRVVWIDFLDVPFFRNMDQIFFEPGGGTGTPSSGLIGARHTGPLPVARFPWDDVSARLTPSRGDATGTAEYEYVDPVIGDAALSTLDCRAFRLSKVASCRIAASSANAVCLVLEGAGETTVGGEVIAWERNDLFTLPQWLAVEHRATTENAAFICVSDRPLLRRLGLFQERED